MSDITFRSIILLNLALIAASVGAMFIPDGYSQELADAYAAEPSGWLTDGGWLPLTVIGALIAAWLMGLVGLLLFKRWGRTLSLYSTLAEFVVYPFQGPSISSALESTFLEASILLWGVVLALAYFSTVSARFGR
jgi:hypothetical protein